ncbi:PREDICTED: trichohyalin-like isoform X2 [Cyphomyrmex costatus]|uniref:trichohyalin-like isoform X2 n=1 Tax=Cyphomyrmex costatus TaxID=456900 RepID=UPI0008523943|nr:PREDICTED: trichohyalin-like isoform X2 [Cyphomyrmex costatus]
MAEEERISFVSDASQSKDILEEPNPDISISLLDIQMPETPDSTRGQTSDGDTSRLESPKPVKPVLGKLQAKKRLMAFANQFKVLPKSQVKPNLSYHSTGALKTKDKSVQDDINKSRKKTEEKILAIEEIRREESKSKMLLAEARAAASIEDENHTGKNISSLLKSKKHMREKTKHEEIKSDRKSRSVDRKYSERPRHHDKINKDSSNQDVKNRSGSIERFTQKLSQNRGKHKKDKKKKNDKEKQSNSKTDTNRDKKEEKDKKEVKEKEEETKEKTETTKNKKENIKERRTDMSEMEVENKDKKDKDKWKEKVLLKSNSWAEVRKSGLSFDDVIHLRRRNNSERPVKIRTTQDYTRYFEQMLMLSNHRLKRQALIAEGLDGPKKYPPESIKLTKRARGLQLLYCENPRTSLLLGISQLLQAVTPERREKIRDICEASLPRIDTEDTVQQKRNWYRQINTINYHKDTRWHMTIQLPKSKWDSEDEEISSINVTKEEIEKSVNKLHISINQQERCSTTSSITDEGKIDNNVEDIKEDIKSSEKIENETINESSTSSLLQPTGNEKLASEYEQFMKMVCTATDGTKKYSPKKNPVKSTSPYSYHEFNIESNLAEDNIEIPLKEEFEEKNNLETLEESTKSTECEEFTVSTDCQIQANENIEQIEYTNENDESQDSKSIPSDWENVRIKVERLSDENTELREVKKKKKKKISSSDSSSTITSSDSEKQKKKRKRKRKVPSNSSSSDSDSTDSTSSSDSSSSEERRKRKRKKKRIGKKRKKVKRIARIKKKRKRKMSTDSNSSDLDECTKKKKRNKKKTMDTKSINGNIRKIISKSPVIASSDGTKILQSMTPIRKIKEEVAGEDKKKIDEVMSTNSTIIDMSVRDNECLKQRKERKEDKSDESFMEQWEMDSMTKQQNDGETSSQDHGEELEKMDGLEKNKYRRKRKHSRDNIDQDKAKANEERIYEGKVRSDEEIEAKRKKRKEKDIKSSGEFLANWERESERITQRIQNEDKYLKKLGKQKKEKWGETDFDTLNVPSLTQLEKEVHQKQLLADEWEVDSLEAISDLNMSKRKHNQSLLKKTEKEVKYDKKTDTYIAIEKEGVREMKKKQERLYAIRIWEEEQEEGEREEMMLLEQKNKTNDWDIEEKSLFCKTTKEMEVCKVNDIAAIQKEWATTEEKKDIKKDTNKLTMKSNKRVKKSRWDIGSQSEEKSEAKNMWEEEYVEWSKSKCEQEFEETKKGEPCLVDYSESSNKSELTDFYHRKSQSRESLERSWASDEVAIRPIQAKKDVLIKQSTFAKTSEEQFVSIKEQSRDKFKEISETDVKLKEKTYKVELYSPSSPALSQKDAEISNENSSNSLLREKRKKEVLITADELLVPMSGIPLQLIKRDTKHMSSEKTESILNKMQLEDRDSTHNFDIKTTDNLFDNISINESCLKIHTPEHIDIFAEYGSEKSCDKQHATNSNVNSATHTKDDEVNEGKNALKLIPKQLLIRRTNEQVKSKRILETPLQDPAQHAAALLTIQKKLLESHALKNDIKEYPNQKQIDHFEQKYSNRDTVVSNSRTDNTLLDTTEFSVVSKASVIAIRRSRSPTLEKDLCSISVRSEQSEHYDRENKNDDVKRYKTNRNLNEISASSNIRSPVWEHRKRSPSKKESEKRYSHDKDKKEKKSERTSADVDKPDRRDSRSSKADFADRRRFSPLARGRRKKSRSPYVSWERQGSGSRSSGHSWSRSRSKSPKRKDDSVVSTRDKDKDKKREKYDDERSCKMRTDERKERYTRSPLRFGYEDNFKKHGIASSKDNRNDWGRRRHDNMDHEKDTRLYDPIDILRERTMESEKYRDNRFHIEELDHTWQYESNSILRDGNESMDSYTGQDLPLEYDDRSYYREGSLERDMIQSSPQLSKYRRRSNVKREWGKDIDSPNLDRHSDHRIRNRTQRSRYSPVRQERFRRKSRSRSWSPLRSQSRSRSRSRSGSHSRSTSRSRLRMRSQSRSRSRSPFDTRSRVKSVSMSRLKSPEHLFRMSELQSSRSPSPGSDRLNETGRETKNDDENNKFSTSGERGRRIETIIHSGIISGTSILDSEMGINSNMDATNFQYSNEIEGENEYYYTENNLTYPPCIDESSTSSPKRLSLDDRLELELGIKKQQNKDSTGITSEYSTNFNPNVIAYPSPPQQQQMMYRQQPTTVVQVGNVLQVVPADFNSVQSARREVSATVTTPPLRSSQVVRVGNVLQVVPTSLDWSSSSNSGGGGSSSGGQSSIGQSNVVLYSSAVPVPSPSAPMSVPVPVPVPLPVPPTLPATTNTLAPVVTMSSITSLPLSLPVPVPVPVPIPSATVAAFPRNEIQPQKIIQPVYNYEAILETRRKEQEERKRLRELRRKEKERRKIERTNRRALRLLEKNNTTSRQMSGLLDHRKSSIVDSLVLKALKEGDEQTESPLVNPIKEEEATISIKEEDEDITVDEEEEEDEDEIEVEAEDDEEEEEEVEDEDEDDGDDEKPLQMINQRIEIDEAITTSTVTTKDQTENDTRKEWLMLPPPPLKGILVVPGFSPNGNLDLSDTDNNAKDSNDKDGEIDTNNEYDKDIRSDTKSGKSNLAKLKKAKRSKKSVQFADGVKPGEGTSPSGGEGDMPSPPPPKGIDFREGLGDLRRDKIYNSRKSRKQEKRTKPLKAKKKVKVKIIKLDKKPRITPLTAMMMDDSDEMDDRSPPPPPPGSPPPPHLWPSYLSIYNTTVRAIEQSQTTTATLTSIQAPPPPPTPLPLLIPPPPLNYTIQPCSKS